MSQAQPDPFWSGVETGQFPSRRIDDQAADAAITTAKSHWLGERCPACRHTFRLGDQVRLQAGGAVGHLDPALNCGRTEASELADDIAGPESGPDDVPAAEPDRFVEGLLRAWPPVNVVPVYRLGQGDWPVTTTRNWLAAPLCRVCGHTFRAGDTVIVCPCAGGEADPRRGYCQLTVHRDPARGLCCWDDWVPDGTLERCPRTGLRVNG